MPPTEPALRLFCLPYAGGTARAYADWQDALPAGIEVCPVELPGRGRRFGDPVHTGLEPLVDDVVATVADRLDRPYALYGHSFGALVAFETARRLQERGRPPARLAVAAFRSPGTPPADPPLSALPDAGFRRFLGELGGTPRELLDDDAFMELMLPVIRADFRIAETYGDRPDARVNCPLTAFGSADDQRFGLPEVRGWTAHTTARATFHQVPGGHFFLHSHRDRLLELLAAELTR
ncbi:alpha/beta fold hydrolase [Streptomyces sp. TRM70308]|uniref:thioesterase II family protein n=1 Tax=Streptomyces TaxID=1883 RepID=UPI0022496D20|nr:alpha/beta fold hydrolase [Streptomyces sp. JHD 1]MCX2967728.1 alpha/beta fold hydrolase [Streptomyces sp. JHD 1]